MGSMFGFIVSAVVAAGGARGLEVPPAALPAPPKAAPQYFAKLSIVQAKRGAHPEPISAPSMMYVEGADAKMTTRNTVYELECELGVREVDGAKLHRLHGSITYHATPTSPQRTTKFNLLVPNGRRDAVLTDDGLLVELEADVHRPKQ